MTTEIVKLHYDEWLKLDDGIDILKTVDMSFSEYWELEKHQGFGNIRGCELSANRVIMLADKKIEELNKKLFYLYEKINHEKKS